MRTYRSESFLKSAAERNQDVESTVKWFRYKDEYGIIDDFMGGKFYYAHRGDHHVVFRIDPSFHVTKRSPPSQGTFTLDFHELAPQEALYVYNELIKTKTMEPGDNWIVDTVSIRLKNNPWQRPDTILNSLFDLVNQSEAWGRKIQDDYRLPVTWTRSHRDLVTPITTLKTFFLNAFVTGNPMEHDDLITPMTPEERAEVLAQVSNPGFFWITLKLVAHLHLMSPVVEVYNEGTLGKNKGTYHAIHKHCLADPRSEDSMPYPIIMWPIRSDAIKDVAAKHKEQIVAILNDNSDYQISEPYRNLRPEVVLGKCHYHWWKWKEEDFPT